MASFSIDTMINGGSQHASIPLSGAEWTTYRETKAAQLKFKYPRDCGVHLEEGQLLAFMIDGQKAFQGFVFKNDSSMDDLIDVTAYTQMRYLQNQATYLFEQKTLPDIIRMVAEDVAIVVGSLSGSSTPIDLISEENKIVDILDEARAIAMDKEGRLYQIWDDRGKLCLSRLPDDRMLPYRIGDYSLLYNYDYKRTIDDDTYNRVVLYKKDEKTGKYIVVKADDPDNTAKWGVLQHFEMADEKMSEGEMQAKADAILSMRNSVKRELTLEAIGILECEAGCSIHVSIEQEGLSGFALINKAVHRFEGKGSHTMKLTMNMVR